MEGIEIFHSNYREMISKADRVEDKKAEIKHNVINENKTGCFNEASCLYFTRHKIGSMVCRISSHHRGFRGKSEQIWIPITALYFD